MLKDHPLAPALLGLLLFALHIPLACRPACAHAPMTPLAGLFPGGLAAPPMDAFAQGRAAGAHPAAGTPEAAVQALLERHFAGDRDFSIATWSALREGLSRALWEAAEAYATAAWPSDEVPPIHGDPLTDSQEPPSRFEVVGAHVEGSRAEVTVRFADAHRERAVVYLLLHEDGAWRLRDLRYADGARLSDLLAERPQ